MEKKRARLRSRGGKGNIIFQKADETLRVRVLPLLDSEDEFLIEAEHFYLGGDIKGVFSPKTLDKPCALDEAYHELKKGSDEDKEIAKKLVTRQKGLVRCLVYKDTKGKEVDEERSGKWVQLSKGQCEEALDLFLDDDDWGDPADPNEGYDWKLKRTGSGKNDTEYTLTACPKSKISKKYAKDKTDFEKHLEGVIPTYEQTKDYLNQFLGLQEDDDDDNEDLGEEKPRRSNKKKSSSKKKKRRSKD